MQNLDFPHPASIIATANIRNYLKYIIGILQIVMGCIILYFI